LAQTTAHSAQLLQNPGSRLSAVYRYRHKDGSWRWLEGTGTNLLAEPSVQAIVANYRDITAQREANEAHVRRTRQAALRAEVVQALAESVLPLPGVLQRCTEALVRHLDAAFARIWTLNASTQMLELQASAG